jgi:hypothetical protein
MAQTKMPSFTLQAFVCSFPSWFPGNLGGIVSGLSLTALFYNNRMNYSNPCMEISDSIQPELT